MDAVVVLDVAEAGADAERLGDLTQALRAEIGDADVGEATAGRGEAPPPGSRAIDVAAVGSLLVSINGSVDILRHLVATVVAWLSRGPAERSVELVAGEHTLRLSHASADQQERLVEAFIRAVVKD